MGNDDINFQALQLSRARELFSTKKAENEPWLIERAFVRPAEFEYMAGSGSAIIYGKAGSGKTAISHALEQRAIASRSLITHWQPALFEDAHAKGSAAALQELGRVFKGCSQALLESLSADPQPFNETYADTQEFLTWFVQHFPPENKGRLSSRIQRSAPMEGRAFLNAILEDCITCDTEAESSLVNDLTLALADIGWKGGVCVMVDGLESSLASSRDALIAILEIFMSTLEFFENPLLTYKMTLPAELESVLAAVSGLVRDRLTPFRLIWEPRHLAAIIERRLLTATGSEIALDEIYARNHLLAWLEGCGGITPRGWIEFIRPIADIFLENLAESQRRKLTKSEWDTARQRSALQLTYIPELDQVTIGRGVPKTLSQETKAIFHYLFMNQDRFCSKREIYYEAYLPYLTGESGSTPANPDAKRVATDAFEYDDLINTAIYRLRQFIEPIPKGESIFISTARNQGYKLSTRAFQGL